MPSLQPPSRDDVASRWQAPLRVDYLRGVSSHSNRKLVDVAREIASTGKRPS